MPNVVLLPGTVTGWTNSNNAKADDGAVANDTANPGTGVLSCSNYNAAGTIPSSATITAIQGRIKKDATGSGSIAPQMVDFHVQLFWVSGGTQILGADQADGVTHWVIGTLTDSFYGGSNSTWGWVPVTSIVLDSSFGIRVQGEDLTGGGSGNLANIDVVEMTLWYDTTIPIPTAGVVGPVFVKPEVVCY